MSQSIRTYTQYCAMKNGLIKNSTEIFCNFKKRVLKIFGIRNKIFSLQKIKKHSTKNSKKLRNQHAVYPKFCRFFRIFPILLFISFDFFPKFFRTFLNHASLRNKHSILRKVMKRCARIKKREYRKHSEKETLGTGEMTPFFIKTYRV